MSRIITADRRKQIADARLADPDGLGPLLGELIIEGNVPIEAVAGLMSVSDVTIYRWMYGTSRPRDLDKIQKLKRFVTVLRKAKRARDLPLSGTVKERIKATGAMVMAHRPAPKAGA
jgi:hypothetical protein